jgi:inosose dehydratase
MTQIHHHLMTWAGWLNKQKQPFELAKVLAEVKAAGYDGFEHGGDAAGLGPAKELKKLIADSGVTLASWSAGITYNPWPPATESFKKCADYAAELGVKTVVVCGGFNPNPRRTTSLADYRLFGENYAPHAEHAKKNGQTLAFHPHRGCIVETLAEIDALIRFVPDLKLCVDTGHLLAVGDDPLVVLDAHADRVVSLHLKDFAKNGADEKFAELGRGSLDLAGVADWVRRRDFRGPIVVERDDPPMPGIESAKISLAAWRKVMPAAPAARA